MKKSLLDIQQEIRDLDNKIKSISSQVSSIYDEIDEFRNKDAIKGNLDYEMIRRMSTLFTFDKHPLNKLENIYGCKIYIETLLSLVQLDREHQTTINRLIFIQWLINESGLNMKLEDLFKEMLDMSPNIFDKLISIFSREYREYLIVDVLIVANICGQANKDILSYIVNLCIILGISRERIQNLSIIAKSILKQNIDTEKNSYITWDYLEKFKHYMNNKNDKDIFLQKTKTDKVLNTKNLDFYQRTIAFGISNFINFTWVVNQRSSVKKGDLLVTYTRQNSSYEISINVIAPCSGTIFLFSENGTNYGVISSSMDNIDSVKAWALKKGK